MSNSRGFLPPVISFPKKKICLGWTHNLLLSFFFYFEKATTPLHHVIFICISCGVIRSLLAVCLIAWSRVLVL